MSSKDTVMSSFNFRLRTWTTPFRTLLSHVFFSQCITADGVKPNPVKIKVVKEFKKLTNVKQMQSFLGLAGYYSVTSTIPVFNWSHLGQRFNSLHTLEINAVYCNPRFWSNPKENYQGWGSRKRNYLLQIQLYWGWCDVFKTEIGRKMM